MDNIEFGEGRFMSNYSVFLPSYSIGVDSYKKIPYVTRRYGNKVVVIGGKTAISKSNI